MNRKASEESVEIVRRVMTHLAAGELDEWAQLMADDAVIECPFSVPWIQRRFEGRAAWDPIMREFFGGALFKKFEWTSLNLFPAEDPTYVFGTGSSRGVTVDGKPTYENEYSWIFRVHDKKMTLYLEHFNPLNVIRTFGNESGAETRPVVTNTK